MLEEAVVLKITRISSYFVPVLIIIGTAMAAFAASFQRVSHGFVLKAERTFTALNITAYLYEHLTLGCQFLHISSPDNHNFFSTTFRTIPTDNSGVFNVIRKMVESGSEEFPVSQLYNEMKKRSIATSFQSEYSDEWTSYHLSTTSANDFFNLLKVQLDSVFHPLMTNELFSLKCHRLEFDTIDDPTTPLHRAGSAYSEALAATQKANTLFANGIKRQLFPGSILKNQFIGSPDSVKLLTLRTVRETHAKYYHPSNALFFHYGSIPKDSVLKAVSKAIESYKAPEHLFQEQIEVQEKWKNPVRIEEAGPCDRPLQPNNGKAAVAWVAGDLMNVSDVIDLEFLSVLLTDSPVSPLYKSLIKPGLASKFMSTGYFPNVRNPYFVVGTDGVDPKIVGNYAEQVVKIMENASKTGFASSRVQSLLNRCEMQQKEITASQGHKYWNQVIRSWVHSVDPLTMLDVSWETERMFRLLAVQPRYFEMVLKQKIIENKHRLEYVMKCSPTYLEDQIRKDKQELTEIKAKLTPDGKARLVSSSKWLQSRREMPGPVHILPSITIEDLKETIQAPIVDTKGVSLVTSNVNGIVYVDIKGTLPLDAYLAEELNLLGYVLPYIGTEWKSDDEFLQQQQLHTDGISINVKVNDSPLGQTPEIVFVIHAATLSRNIASLFSILQDVILFPNIDNYEQLHMLLLHVSAHYDETLDRSESGFVKTFAKAGFSEAATLNYLWHPASVTRRVMKAVTENKQMSVFSSLKIVYQEAFRKARFSAMIHCSSNDQPLALDLCSELLQRVNSASQPVTDRGRLQKEFDETKALQKVFFVRESQDMYASSVAIPPLVSDTADLATCAVLTKLMESEFLQVPKTDQDIIGTINGEFDEETGIISFTTDHDKNPSLVFKTIETSLDKIASGNFTSSMLSRAKIQVLASLDHPQRPSEQGLRSFLSNIPSSEESRYRANVMLVSPESVIEKAKQAKSATHRYSCIGPSQEAVIPPDFTRIDISPVSI